MEKELDVIAPEVDYSGTLNEKNDEQTDNNVERIQLIVFKIGRQEYGLPIDQIKEVVLTPNITAMPETPVYIKGVANVRGNIISILDLETRFGIGANSEVPGKYTLVVASEEYKMGFLVKDVPNTLSVPVNKIEEAQNVLGDVATETKYINGIAKLKDRLVILFDVYEVLQKGDLELINL